jgi:predicted transcriptional regulator
MTYRQGDFFTMGMRFVLKETLEELNVSAHQLVVKSEVRKNTIYDMIHNKTKRIEVDNMGNIIRTLNEFAKMQGIKRKFNSEDVMIYEDK